MPASSPRRSGRLPRLAAAGVAALAAALLLSSCAPSSPAPSAPPATAGDSASAPATDSGAPASPTPTPTEAPIPYAVSCDAVLTPQDVYDFNPNFGLDTARAPKSGVVLAAKAAGGTACVWTNQTSHEPIEVGLAKLPPNALTAQKGTAATSSTAVPTYGTPPAVEGYFARAGDTGTAQVFTTAGVWVVVSSPALFEPGDAQRLMQAILGHLPA